jgi:hypothetical protein|eukprot:SAG25_NODE_106_length_15358_cov_22.913559_7_plen_379_part_00
MNFVNPFEVNIIDSITADPRNAIPLSIVGSLYLIYIYGVCWGWRKDRRERHQTYMAQTVLAAFAAPGAEKPVQDLPSGNKSDSVHRAMLDDLQAIDFDQLLARAQGVGLEPEELERALTSKRPKEAISLLIVHRQTALLSQVHLAHGVTSRKHGRMLNPVRRPHSKLHRLRTQYTRLVSSVASRCKCRCGELARKISKASKRDHPWISCAFVDAEDVFTRPQRVTVLMCVVMGTLAIASFFFDVDEFEEEAEAEAGGDGEDEEVEWKKVITTALVVAVLMSPCDRLFVTMFRHVEGPDREIHARGPHGRTWTVPPSEVMVKTVVLIQSRIRILLAKRRTEESRRRHVNTTVKIQALIYHKNVGDSSILYISARFCSVH